MEITAFDAVKNILQPIKSDAKDAYLLTVWHKCETYNQLLAHYRTWTLPRCFIKHFIIFLNFARPLNRHLFYLNAAHFSVVAFIFPSKLFKSVSLHDVKGLKPLEQGALLWASRRSVSGTGTGAAVIQLSAQRWAHRQPYSHRRTLCLFPRREGNFRPKLDWIDSPALVRFAPIDYRLGQRPQHS